MDFQTTIPETTPTPDIAPEIAEASFDIVARQDRTEAEVTALRSDVEDVKARVDRISRAAARPALAPSGQESAPEVKGFVDGYLRRGAAHEIKSISGAAPSDGGYAVPRQIDAAIARALTEISPIRAIAQVVQTGSAGYRKLVTTGGTASGWVSETAARPGTATPDFHEIAPPTGELYANPAASQAMLDDVGFDLQAWLASEIAMVAGYPFRDGSTVTAEVGSKKFELFTEGENAWTYPNDDGEIINAMKAGAAIVMTGTSSRGTQTIDRFSLLGFTDALTSAQTRCK